MFRDRFRAWARKQPAATRPEVPAAAAIAGLYSYWQTAGNELELLASRITRRRVDEALRSLERACASVRITDEMLELLDLTSWGATAGSSVARHLRLRLLAEILPWLEAARRELSAAASTLCDMASDADSHETALAALRQLVRVPVPQPLW